MAVRYFRSTDTGAPVVTGVAGSLLTLLDACLVNGYGAKTAAGWTIAYTATNKRAYQQAAGGNATTPMYLYIDDAAPGSHGGREARATGFETMSAIATGTGQFPTLTQQAIGIGSTIIRKSATADATPRPWAVIANGQTVYVFIESGDQTNPIAGCTSYFFGDIKPILASDPYAVMNIGRSGEAGTDARWENPMMILPNNGTAYSMNNVMIGHFLARHWTGLGGSVKCGKIWDISRLAGSGGNSGVYGGWSSDGQSLAATGVAGLGRFLNAYGPYPDLVTGGMNLAPVLINHNYGIRGTLRGLWGPLHDRPLQPYDVITVSSGPMAGKTFMAIHAQYYTVNGVNADTCCVMMEISDTWD